MSNKKLIVTWVLVAAVVVAGIFWLNSLPDKPGELDAFASCLADRGAMFYGTFWCKFCKSQKEMFGRSVSKLPYVECSTPDGRSQLKVCTDKSIEGYPTWVFADESRLSGVIPLLTLSEKTGCELPNNN